MKKRLFALLLVLALALGLFTGCLRAVDTAPQQELTLIEDTGTPEDELTLIDGDDSQTPPSGYEPEESGGADAVTEDGEYTSPEDVAEYIHTYGHLPSNYITKSKARDLGWDSSAGNLWDAAPGKSIGGDRFGNYEGLLPDGKWKECDVNYSGGYRGAERLIYNDEGSVYYTNDHYKSFTKLY